MYKHILVPTDGSKISLAAAKQAAGLAQKLGARITGVYVMAPFMPPIEADVAAFYPAYSVKGYEREIRKSADKALAKVKAAADRAHVKFDSVAVPGANPWAKIIEVAKKQKCDLIVMASHGRRGLEALLIGSETQKVLTHSKIPVLVCR
jgi:nucleotide-binding universal stress UspA family protein